MENFSVKRLKKIAKKLNIKHLKKYHYGEKDKNEILYLIQRKLTNLKPIGPISENSFLTNIDIKNVLKYIQFFNKNLVFIGPYAIDMHKPYSILQKLDFAKLQKTSKQLVIVWNTDKLSGPGEHWVTLLVNFSKRSLVYFDSLAETMHANISAILHKILSKYPNYKLYYNNSAFQEINGNCGIFVIHFITSLLQGVPAHKYFKNEMINDEMINSSRKNFFRKQYTF